VLSGELLPLARFFDRLEVRLRRLGRWARSPWVGLPAVAKILPVLAGVGALGYAAYYLFFG
jgi:hypothetical protein